MPIYNLIEYSDNYSGISGSLWGFKRDEINNNAEVTNDDNTLSVKYKANLIGNTETDGTKKGVKIAVPLKYLSNFWRSIEMPLINCKVELSWGWIENCVLTTAAVDVDVNTTGSDHTKLYAPIVTLSAEDNVNLSQLLGKGFKRSIYWNKYNVIDNITVQTAAQNEGIYIRERLDASYQQSKDCLFLLLIIQQTIMIIIIKFLLILSKIIFFQEVK